MSRNLTHLIALILLAIPLAGCARDREPLASQAQIATGDYATAFTAAKDELRRLGFSLDRIDARAGIITTVPRTSAGLAMLWERQETTFRQESENLMHRQRRRVTVAFQTRGAGSAGEPEDLRLWDGAILADVRVAVERIYRFGIRPQSTSIRLSSVATDPELVRQGAQPGMVTHWEYDEWLSGRIADQIRRDLPDDATGP